MSKKIFNSFEDLGRHLDPQAVYEKEMRDFFSEKGIESIWHFTDKSNLESIKKYGLQSLHNIEKKKITVERFGADDLSHMLDHSNMLDRYVHLSFVKDHPMYHVALKRGTIIDPVWIEIDLSVVFQDETRFSDRVANTIGVELFSLKYIQKYINFDKMSDQDFETKKEARKAEILIFDSIPADRIKDIEIVPKRLALYDIAAEAANSENPFESILG